MQVPDYACQQGHGSPMLIRDAASVLAVAVAVGTAPSAIAHKTALPNPAAFDNESAARDKP